MSNYDYSFYFIFTHSNVVYKYLALCFNKLNGLYIYVNIKYWFPNFQKKIVYRFSGRIRIFYRRRTDSTKKKLCRPVKHCFTGHNFFPFNLETCYFQVSNMIVLCAAYCFLTILKNSFGWLRSNSSAFFKLLNL
jgi:hypothetical protein